MGFWKTLKDTLHRTRYQIVPPGDTIERASRDQSITMGAVPVYFGFFKNMWHVLPWDGILNWSAFSVNFTPQQKWMGPKGKGEFWQRIYKRLTELDQSGETDRLIAGAA